MAGLTIPAGSRLGHAHAALYSTANVGFYVLDCGANVAAKGGIGSTLEAIARALNPIAFDSEGTAGLVNIAVDNSQWDAASLQATLRALGRVDSINLASATATAGGQFIVSA